VEKKRNEKQKKNKNEQQPLVVLLRSPESEVREDERRGKKLIFFL